MFHFSYHLAAAIPAESFINLLSTKSAQVGTFVKAAIDVVAICVVAGVYLKTRAIGASVAALLTAGLVLFGVHNINWGESHTKDELGSVEHVLSVTPHSDTVLPGAPPLTGEATAGVDPSAPGA